MGMELAQGDDFSVTATSMPQGDFTKNLKYPPTSPSLWAVRKESMSMDGAKMRRCKLGVLRWVAAASRPNVCARLARIAPRINSLCGSDAYRINELARAAKDERRATALLYASPSRP